MNRFFLLLTFLAASSIAQAGKLTDPAGDFISQYQGPKNPDLDVLSIQFLFNGSEFLLISEHAGAPGTTPGSVHLWGINRGAAVASFAPEFPDIEFDFVIGFGEQFGPIFNNLMSGQQGPLPGSAFDITGNTMTFRIPLSLMPSQGLDPEQYAANFWPRSGITQIDSLAEVADFAPDSSLLGVTTVPEPGTFALGGLALIGIGLLRWRRS
jgi:hypothetical protein